MRVASRDDEAVGVEVIAASADKQIAGVRAGTRDDPAAGRAGARVKIVGTHCE
jgi:hypothetical protein